MKYAPTTILAMSYDPVRLSERQKLFAKKGFLVVPATSLEIALRVIEENEYDLLLVGASVPAEDREKISLKFREFQDEAAILWVTAKSLEPTPLADGFAIAGDPEALLQASSSLLNMGKRRPEWSKPKAHRSA